MRRIRVRYEFDKESLSSERNMERFRSQFKVSSNDAFLSDVKLAITYPYGASDVDNAYKSREFAVVRIPCKESPDGFGYITVKGAYDSYDDSRIKDNQVYSYLHRSEKKFVEARKGVCLGPKDGNTIVRIPNETNDGFVEISKNNESIANEYVAWHENHQLNNDYFMYEHYHGQPTVTGSHFNYEPRPEYKPVVSTEDALIPNAGGWRVYSNKDEDGKDKGFVTVLVPCAEAPDGTGVIYLRGSKDPYENDKIANSQLHFYKNAMGGYDEGYCINLGTKDAVTPVYIATERDASGNVVSMSKVSKSNESIAKDIAVFRENYKASRLQFEDYVLLNEVSNDVSKSHNAVEHIDRGTFALELGAMMPSKTRDDTTVALP